MSYVTEREFLYEVRRLAVKHLKASPEELLITFSKTAKEDGSRGLFVVSSIFTVGPIHVWTQHIKTAEDWKSVIESLTEIFVEHYNRKGPQ